MILGLPSGKLTWQWNIPISNGKYIFKWPMFHCYVSLPECTISWASGETWSSGHLPPLNSRACRLNTAQPLLNVAAAPKKDLHAKIGESHPNTHILKDTLQGSNISHLGKRKIIFKMPFLGDMLVPWRVHPRKMNMAAT